MILFFYLEVAVKDFIFHLFRNPAAAVFFWYFDEIFRIFFEKLGTEFHIISRLGVFESIRQQIIHDAFQLGWREPDFFIRFFQTDNEINLLFLRYNIEDMRNLFQEMHDVSFSDVNLHLLHFDFTESEQFVNKIMHSVGIAVDDFQFLAIIIIDLFLFDEPLKWWQDQSQRCFQIMRYVRKEVYFRLIHLLHINPLLMFRFQSHKKNQPGFGIFICQIDDAENHTYVGQIGPYRKPPRR